MTNSNRKPAEVRRTSNTAVEVIRSFNADRNLVFKAYTVPSLVKRWMLGPPGWHMPVCEMDLKEGGPFRWRWKNDSDKSEFGFTGVFRQVIPLQKIVHTQIFDPGNLGVDFGGGECLVTATFSENGDVTTVTTKIEYQSKEDLEKALATGMTDGMEMSYKSLDEILPSAR